MKSPVKLPYFSRYFSGEMLNLEWLKAVTVNDNRSARRLEWHCHDELELIFPLKGRYQYEFRGRRPVTLDNANFIIVPGGVMHRLNEAIDPPGARMHLYLNAPQDITANTGSFTEAEYERLFQALTKHPLVRLHASHQLKAVLSPLGRIVLSGTPALSQAAILQSRFLCCLLICESVSCSSNTAIASESRIIDEAARWLEHNHSSSIHMDWLTSHIGYSRSRLFALFKKQMNMTPGEYLRNYRLEKAKGMLLRTSMPAADVGQACGLGSSAQFARMFKKMTGLTPLAYRRSSQSSSPTEPS